MPVPPSRRVARDRRRRLRRLFLVLCAAGVVGIYAGPVRSYLDARTASAHTAAAVRTLRERAAALDRRLHALHSDTSLIALAREDGFIMPGETPYRASVPGSAPTQP